MCPFILLQKMGYYEIALHSPPFATAVAHIYIHTI